MERVRGLPIQRLLLRFDRLDGQLVALVIGSGAVVTLGFIELLRSPLQQLSSTTIEVLAVRAMLFLAPLLVSLLLLLHEGPQLLDRDGDCASGTRARRPADGRSRAAELVTNGLLCLVLCLYFMAAVIMAASLTLNQGDPVAELSFLVGQLEPARFAAALLKAAAYGAITAAICLQQAPAAGAARPAMARRMARSILTASSVLLSLDLLWAIAIDPLQMGGT